MSVTVSVSYRRKKKKSHLQKTRRNLECRSAVTTAVRTGQEMKPVLLFLFVGSLGFQIRNATVATQSSIFGFQTDWINLSNWSGISSTNWARTRFLGSYLRTSTVLYLSGFRFSVPANSKIDGVTLYLTRGEFSSVNSGFHGDLICHRSKTSLSPSRSTGLCAPRRLLRGSGDSGKT